MAKLEPGDENLTHPSDDDFQTTVEIPSASDVHEDEPTTSAVLGDISRDELPIVTHKASFGGDASNPDASTVNESRDTSKDELPIDPPMANAGPAYTEVEVASSGGVAPDVSRRGNQS